jgi:hypothetical protein
MRQLPSVPKNAISLNHRYLKTFTNSCGEPENQTMPLLNIVIVLIMAGLRFT